MGISIVGAIMMAAIGALMLFTCHLIAAGRYHRNGWSGIRLPSTMTSERAWDAAHRTALPMWRAAGWFGLAAAGGFLVLLVLRVREDAASVVYVVALVVLLVLVTTPVPRAIRAAEEAERTGG